MAIGLCVADSVENMDSTIIFSRLLCMAQRSCEKGGKIFRLICHARSGEIIWHLCSVESSSISLLALRYAWDHISRKIVRDKIKGTWFHSNRPGPLERVFQITLRI